MRQKNIEKNLELVISDDLMQNLVDTGLDHLPNEFGGYLIGKYSEDQQTAIITGYILPKEFKATKVLFEPSVKGVEKEFVRLYEDKQEYYIGEWHTHPYGSSRFSNTDLLAMERVVQTDSVCITNPLLLILSLNDHGLKEFTFYCYDNKRLIAYE